MNLDQEKPMFCALLVDSHVSYRQALSDVLFVYFPSLGVDEAGDADEAQQKVDYQRPNIIFMEIDLPGKSGLVLTKEIKQVYSDIEIIILTTSNQPKCRQQALRCGADFYISKQNDFYMEEILTRIEEAMGGRKQHS
jgi:DNA-binding NarL/FixJ family response regulator